MRKIFKAFIPDYPSYFQIPSSMYKYRIDLYDKDNDIYVPVFYHDDIETITNITVSFRTLIKQDLLIGENDEPFDNAIIVNNITNQPMLD